MRFIPFDIGTYRVKSRTRDGHHILDIREGTCSCEGFEFYKDCDHLRSLRRQLGLYNAYTPMTINLATFL